MSKKTEYTEKELAAMTPYKRWYVTHKEDFAKKRRARYKKDAEYRKAAIENAKRYREENPAESTLDIPPEYEYSFGTAAVAVGVDTSTLRDWLTKEYYPRPKLFGSSFYLTSDQVGWLIKVREFFDLHGSRRGAKTDEFENLKALLRANW